MWSPYSGFWRTDDGWIRTHGNYPHHAAALLRGLQLAPDADADAVRAALEQRTESDALSAITTAGGLAVAVRAERPDEDRALRDTPVLDIVRFPGRVRPPRRIPEDQPHLPCGACVFSI
ncbi:MULTISPECIES: hypothetical protein [unclassified Microbacterium]|uniref:hypothetical protein n=1 Tax=unclassified Microbacterium TaxID=2609290 RepID=UPI001FCED7D0|nr:MULTISPECIES: hypothetical protein [unclassified Microbacterium]